jgi:hypothetical protein
MHGGGNPSCPSGLVAEQLDDSGDAKKSLTSSGEGGEECEYAIKYI